MNFGEARLAKDMPVRNDHRHRGRGWLKPRLPLRGECENRHTQVNLHDELNTGWHGGKRRCRACDAMRTKGYLRRNQ